MTMPVGYESGQHTLVLGATGSGKTVSEAWIVCRLIEAGHGAVVIDPKGDGMLREELALRGASAASARSWNGRPRARSPTTPTPTAPRPRSPTRRCQARSSPSPTTCARPSATSATPCARCTPPASRSPRSRLMAHLDPRELEVLARELPEDEAKRGPALPGLADRAPEARPGRRA